jgi:hypothetical protein
MKAQSLIKFLVGAAVATSNIAILPGSYAASDTNALICTISTSHQFAAYAHDRLLSSALCVYAERIKREWLRRMNMPDEWRDPIVIIVRPCDATQTNASLISWQTFQTEKHLKYQIYCCSSPTAGEADLLAVIVDRLCAEWANRDQPTSRGQTYVAPFMPLWLVQGLATSIRGRNDSLLGVARRSIAAGRPLRASGLLDAKVLPGNPAERTLFQANAWIFTESLVTLPGGAEKLRRFLTELGSQKSASNAFWYVYRRDFSQDLTFEKWWSLQQVSHAFVGVAENLTAEETAQQLDDILLTRLDATRERRGLPGEAQLTLSQLWRHTDEPWLKDVLKLKSDRLGALRGQAHPFYEPVIDQYLEAVNWLLQRNTVRFRRTLAKAASARVVADHRRQATIAYMDAAERIYSPEEASKMLTGYLSTLDRFQDLDQQRRNPISDYLDKFDR